MVPKFGSLSFACFYNLPFPACYWASVLIPDFPLRTCYSRPTGGRKTREPSSVEPHGKEELPSQTEAREPPRPREHGGSCRTGGFVMPSCPCRAPDRTVTERRHWRDWGDSSWVKCHCNGEILQVTPLMTRNSPGEEEEAEPGTMGPT